MCDTNGYISFIRRDSFLQHSITSKLLLEDNYIFDCSPLSAEERIFCLEQSTLLFQYLTVRLTEKNEHLASSILSRLLSKKEGLFPQKREPWYQLSEQDIPK
jgi:hypothetical protein